MSQSDVTQTTNIRAPRVLRRVVAVAVAMTALLGVAVPAFAVPPDPTSTTHSTAGKHIRSLAKANSGKMACSTNSLGGTGYYNSCTGYGRQPEYWCADFARWTWAKNGVTHTSSINALAGSFL